MEVLCYTQQRIFPKAGFCFALLQVCVGGSRGRQGKGSSILNTEEATVVTFSAVHQPGGVSRCSAEILGDVASHPPPPRLVPPSVFSGASTRGTFSSYKALLPSLLCSTPGSLGLPPSLWHFSEHPFAQGKFLDAPARHPGHRHKRGRPARGAGWELRCCDRVPRQSLTASPDLPSGNTFSFSCTANVWTGFPGAFGATFRSVPVILPCCQLAGKGRWLCQDPSGLLEGQISALPCNAGAKAALWPGQRGQPEQELLGVCSSVAPGGVSEMVTGPKHC